MMVVVFLAMGFVFSTFAISILTEYILKKVCTPDAIPISAYPHLAEAFRSCRWRPSSSMAKCSCILSHSCPVALEARLPSSVSSLLTSCPCAVIGIVGLLIFIIFFGILYGLIAEDWNFVESLYWTVVTMTTVGYGDYAPMGQKRSHRETGRDGKITHCVLLCAPQGASRSPSTSLHALGSLPPL